MPPNVRTGKREPTELPRSEWPRAGAWLGQALRASGIKKRRLLSLMRYEGGTNRLNSYIAGMRRPTAKTLRAICENSGIAYLEAVRQFGYYGEYINALDDLVWLGEEWLEKDDAGGRRNAEARVESLRFVGLLFWRGAIINHETLSDKEFLARCTAGVWHEEAHPGVRVTYPPVEVQPGTTVTMNVPRRLDFVNPRLKREAITVPEQTVWTVLPKPIALAITLAVLMFPRRGDVYKDETLPYLQLLLPRADSMIEEAAALRAKAKKVGRPKALHPLLGRTLETLTDHTVDFLHRRVIAAEYTIPWVDSLCQPFTEYVRLASFAYWGEAGSSVSTVTEFVDRPQRRKAALPDIQSLTSYT